MAPNTSILGYDPSDILPHLPEKGKSTEETVEILYEFCHKLLMANQDLAARLNTSANVGFLSWTDGTDTTYSYDTSAMDLSSLTSVDASVNFDVPLMRDITWSVDGGVPKWTSGTLAYGGEDYTIAAWSSGDTTAATRGIYWQLATPTVFHGVDDPIAVSGRWYMAFFDGTSIYPALQSTIVHGGLVGFNDHRR